MRVDLFVEGPLLRFAFAALLAGISFRVVFFLRAIVSGACGWNSGWSYVLASLGRSLLPFHMGVRKRPVYACLRYAFHACLLLVPVFLSGHIALWEESRFGWGWSALPDTWADRLTLLVLASCLAFLLRRTFGPEVRRFSSVSDRLFLLVVSLPFLTGYCLAHGLPASVPFLQKSMWTLHVLSGEVLLMTAAILFYKARLIPARCTGCAACALRCPTGTLEATDSGTERVFHYAHYRCIGCASCVAACPEGAAELRHEVGLRPILPRAARVPVHSVPMQACANCSSLFVPEPQWREVLAAVGNDLPRFCPRCRQECLIRLVTGRVGRGPRSRSGPGRVAAGV